MYTVQGLVFEVVRLLIIVMGLVNIPLIMIKVCREYRKQEATKVDVFIKLLLSLIVFSGCLLLFFLKPFENLGAFAGIPMPGENEAMLQFSANCFFIIGKAMLVTATLACFAYCVRYIFKKDSKFQDWAGYLFFFLLFLSAFFW